MTVDGDGALLGQQRAVEDGEQRGFARTGTTHHRQHLAAVKREAQVMHAVVAARKAEVDVPSAELHGTALLL